MKGKILFDSFRCAIRHSRIDLRSIPSPTLVRLLGVMRAVSQLAQEVNMMACGTVAR